MASSPDDALTAPSHRPLSVPSQWVMDYRATLGKYAGFGLGQRGQLMDIFEVRGQRRVEGAGGVQQDVWGMPAEHQGWAGMGQLMDILEVSGN